MQQARAYQEGLPIVKKIKSKRFKKNKTLHVGWDESELSDSDNELKVQEANLRLTNTNVCFIANNDEVTFDHYISQEEIEDA